MPKLSEELKKTFYSSRESKDEVGRNDALSTTTPAALAQEPDMVLSDVSYNYVLGGQIDFILTQRNNLIRKWREVTYLPEVDEAIQEICNEALVFDEEEVYPFEISMEDLEITDALKEKIEASFTKIMNLLDFMNKGEELFKNWYVDGVLNFEAVYDNKKIKEGIKKIIMLPPFDFFKIKDINSGEITFFYSNRLSSDRYNAKSVTLLQLMNTAREELKYKPEQITQITSGVPSRDRLFSISNINKAMKAINQVTLIEDSILIYRITRAPEKKVFYIDTGKMPKGKAEQYIKNMMTKHRNRMIYNATDGTIENRKERVSIQEDFWLPRSIDGRGTQIETLPGTGTELGEIEDLNFFYDKLYRALNVPVNRRDRRESRSIGLTPNNLELEKEELKFNKFIFQLRKRFILGIKDLLKKDLLSTNTVSLEDWHKIKDKVLFIFKNNNEYAEMKKLQVFDSRMNIAQTALQLKEEKVVSAMWIRKEVMNQTDEEIKQIDKEIEEELAKYPDEEEGGGGGFR